MSDLPEDLVEEILCRVPATSLTQLQSTCKRWNSLFNKKRFTRKHSDKAAKQFLVLILKKSRVYLMNVNLHRRRPVEVTGPFSLIDSLSRLNQFKISNISHCDGLLLCTDEDYNRHVVWNPCTGQTRLIPPIDRCDRCALGSYQDNKSGDNNYKILCFNIWGTKYQIYEINSCLWRTLDVNTLDCFFEFNESGMYLKGKTYWFASDKSGKKTYGIFLVSFDYTTEIFERLLLPCQYPSYETASLSVVREEKLAVLLQHKNTTRTEIWVTKKIDETKLIVSWSNVLTVDLEPELGTWRDVSFFFDEEKKLLVCCDINVSDRDTKHMVYIVGEDNEVRKINFGKPTSDPILLNYVPSLTRIQQSGSKRKKRERGSICRYFGWKRYHHFLYRFRPRALRFTP